MGEEGCETLRAIDGGSCATMILDVFVKNEMGYEIEFVFHLHICDQKKEIILAQVITRDVDNKVS